MKILTLDIEHKEGVFRPWDGRFYISCIPLLYCDGADVRKFVLWFDHTEYKDIIPTRTQLDIIQEYIDKADLLVGLNIKHDLIILRHYGIKFEERKLWCTSLVEYLLAGQDPKRGYGMDDIATHYGLPVKPPKIHELWNAGVETKNIDIELLQEYSLHDVQTTFDIYTRQVPQVAAEGMTALVNLQNEFTHSLIDMEYNGFKFDTELAEKIYAEYSSKAIDIERELLELFGEPRLNLESSKQLSAAVFGGKCRVKWKEWVSQTLKSRPETRYWEKELEEEVTMAGFWDPPPKRKNEEDGQDSVAKDVITRLSANTPARKRVKNLLLELSAALKIKETLRGKSRDSGLINKVVERSLVHPSFNQTVTATGRLSSSDPNGQNMPRDGTSPIKRCISSRFKDGVIVQWDLSQIEWRDAAWFSQDPVMIHEINNGVDQHTEACIHIMELPLNKENRTFAKIFNFRMIYGGSAYGFFADPKMPSFNRRRWQTIVEEFYKKYAGLKEWHESLCRIIPCQGGVFQIQTGRKFTFHKVIFKDGVWSYNERQFKNYPIQGMSGGDILPLAAAIIRRGLRKNKIHVLPILTVHDSLVYDCPPTELERLTKLLAAVSKQLQQRVGRYYNIKFNVHLAGEIECGPTYGDLKKVEV